MSGGCFVTTPVIDEFIKDSQIDNQHKATLINQKQRLLLGLSPDENSTTCIELLKEAIMLNPDEPAFHHNLAHVLNYEEQYEQAYEHMKICLQLDEQKEDFDADHLETAIKLCRKLGEQDEYSRLAKILLEKSPYKFQLMKALGQI